MRAIDGQRPSKLYCYSEQRRLERSLMLGEFHLRPAADGMRQITTRPVEQILPFRAKAASIESYANYLTLSMAKVWNDALFETFSDADCCLVIHRPEEFGERIHQAAARMLPNWTGIDAAVSYGIPSPLGAAFSKARQEATQQEWLFAWRPITVAMTVSPVVIQIGNIEDIAELRKRSR